MSEGVCFALGAQAPVLVEVDREGFVESRHRGNLVVLDRDGATRLALGAVDVPILPRSCVKPLQATAMLETGVELAGERLALVCSSHSGEPRHVELVHELLAAFDLTADCLRNTPDAGEGDDLVAGRVRASCSGKHAGMLVTCAFNGWPLDSYLSPEHPLQLRIRDTVERLTGGAVGATVRVDGCGAPLFAVSLRGLARAYAVLAHAPEATAERRVADAMRAHPWVVAGSGRDATELMVAVPGSLAKDGVEGLFVAALGDGGAVAVKVEDGDAGQRAATRCVIAGLRSLGVEGDTLEALSAEPVTGGGQVVGSVHSVVAACAPRVERDLLGSREVPGEAYYGIHTLRACENFAITATPISVHPELIAALASVKQAAALANCDVGSLAPEKAAAIVRACEEIRGGALHDHFVVDVIQGGAGTSTNMNANEVIANRALELLGRRRGEYEHLSPLDDVNMSQSTNDVYPASVDVALHTVAQGLLQAMTTLRLAFAERAEAHRDVLKLGRTQLQDAVPMTFGQELRGYAVTIGEDELRLHEACELLREVNLGGTAIGTGLNAPSGYAELVCAHLAELTGIPLVTSPDLVEATSDMGAFVQLSSVLKRIAIKLSKICNDLRLLSSGPDAGFGEINLPRVQAGSSIMPAKVNPVIPEVVSQVAYEVIGNDVTVSFAAEGGQLQLNAFGPIIAHSILTSLQHLRSACLTLAERCVVGITVNRESLRASVEHSVGLIAALAPYIGHATCAAIAVEALATGRSIYELTLERGLLEPAQLDEILSAERQVAPLTARSDPERAA